MNTDARIEKLEAEVKNLYENLNPLLPGGRREPVLKAKAKVSPRQSKREWNWLQTLLRGR